MLRHAFARAALQSLILLGLAVAASAQSLRPASPESVGLSAERLERLSDALQKYVDDGQVAGSVTLVARRGSIAYFEAFGERDREAKRTDADGRDLPHRVAVESHRQRRRDDARRGRQAAADGPRRQVLARVHGDEGRRRARRRRLRRREGRAADHGSRLADAHVGLRLRQRRRRRSLGGRRPDGLLLRGPGRADSRLRARASRRCRRTRSPARSGSTATTRTSSARSSRSSPASRSTKSCASASSSRSACATREFYLPRGKSDRLAAVYSINDGKLERAPTPGNCRRPGPLRRRAAQEFLGRRRACCRRPRTTRVSCR